MPEPEKKIHQFTEVPYAAFGGQLQARNLVRAHLGKWERYLQMIRHPTTGMAARRFLPHLITEAERECLKMIDFYQELLEAM